MATDRDTERPARLLIPITDTCAMLGGITRPTLYDLINGGELDRVRIGRRSFITAQSIHDYVDRRMRESAAALEAGADA